MRILFLDIDGPLNAHERLPTGYCGIRREFADRLNTILDAVPDCKLVISSAWRYMILRGDMTLKGFEYLLLVHGVKAFNRVVGHTVADGEIADEPPHDDVEAWNRIGLEMRAEQIRQYCREHDVTRWAVLDDLPLIVDRFVHVDGALGLSDENVVRAIELLEAE